MKTLTFFRSILLLSVFQSLALFSMTSHCDTSLDSAVKATAETALDRYINKDDGQYQWEFVRSEDHFLYTGYQVFLTSQKWLTEKETSRPLWQHDLMIYMPKRIISKPGGSFSHEADSAIIFVDGGSHESTSKFDDTIGMGATLYNKIIIEVRQVPNQPFYFKADDIPQDFKEDDIVSRSFELYLDTGNEEWPIYLPMVKSVVKAMDASSEFLAQELDLGIEYFSVVGASKRGWTTWLTAAVDQRVIGIVPTVIDVLDVEASMENQFESYGDYYSILHTYYSKDLPCRFKTPQGQALLDIVDPISYQDRLVGMPKLLLNGTSDPFFANTNSLGYWRDVASPKNIRFVPNAAHNLPMEALLTGFGFASKAIDEKGKTPAPDLFWQANREDNTLTVYSSKFPFLVNYWSSENDVLDFRLETTGDEAWSSEFVSVFDMKIHWLDPNEDGEEDMYFSFTKDLTAPDSGFRANMFTLNFGTQTYSTSIFMSPEVVPYKGTHCP